MVAVDAMSGRARASSPRVRAEGSAAIMASPRPAIAAAGNGPARGLKHHTRRIAAIPRGWRQPPAASGWSSGSYLRGWTTGETAARGQCPASAWAGRLWA